MINDKLYELAFSYKKTRLWNKLTDTHIFAVKLSDGSIGHVCIMGMIGEHCALALYVGDEGFNSWRNLYNAGNYIYPDPFELEECMFRQNCLQCEFTSKNMLSEEEYSEARDYVRRNGIRVSGSNAYPQFVKYSPECHPWHLQDEKDKNYLCEALSAAIEVARLLEENDTSLNLKQIHGNTKYVPLFELKDGAYTVGKTEIPEDKPYEYPEPELNDLYAARLKKAKKIGVWECEIIRIPEAVQDEPDEVPVYPMALIAVDVDLNQVFPIVSVTNYAENSENMLNQFTEALLEKNVCPRSIRVRDERTYSFFKSLCERVNIPLSIDEDTDVLDEAIEDFLDFMDGRPEDIERGYI